MAPPLVLDIDGTLTTPDGTIDPRAFDLVRSWDAPVVLATGKAFPYPVALCHFMGIPETVVAENGGVVYADDTVTLTTDGDRPKAAAAAFVDRGGDLGWGAADTVNRWRETEIAVHLDADEALLRDVAADYGLDVVDTGYAFHLKNPGVEKGRGVEAVAETLGVDPESFVAVGDSENDASTFAVVGRSFAVANADATASAAADVVTDGAYMDGTLEALDSIA
jgi:hypothetical protein